MRQIMQALACPLLLLALASCGASRVSDADGTPTASAREPTAQAAALTVTPAGPVASPTAVLPTAAPPTIAPTAVPGSATPTIQPTLPPPTLPPPTLPPPTDTPSPTAARVAERVAVPGGSSNGVAGELRLRGLFDEPVAETPVVRGQLALRAVVRDPDAGPDDGDGVLAVSFFVLDPQGNVVYETVEENAAFCLSGGDDPACALIDIGPRGSWPNGNPVTYGVHQINMDIAAGANGVNNDRGAFWFTFVDIQPPAE